jgi:DNA-binding response OmpR family regulator
MLDIEKIEAGKMQFKRETISANQLLQEALETNRGYADHYQVSLAFTPCEDDVTIIADHDRSLQVLANLISNACKFSPIGTQVLLNIAVAGSLLDICVTDYGSGISAEFSHKIFDKFAQADSSMVRGKEGTGLGLALSRQMVQQMGGDLRFTSIPHLETTFCFSLPLANPMPLEDPPKTNNKARILIVEDDPDIARLLSLMLKEHGLSSHIARDATEALLLLNQHCYAAMTLDLMLPNTDGSQLLAQLRQQANTKKLPVIAVSAISGQHKDQLSSAYAVLDVLSKPINENALIHAIERALNIQRAHHLRPRILHIEDDADIANLFSTLLGSEFDYRSANTLAIARACLRDYQPDLILLDLELPDGSGTQFFDDLQAAGLSDRPVVVFSAQEQPQENLFNSVSHYLVKSRTSNQALLETLTQLTQRHNTASANDKGSYHV